jgi:outer membrane protein OmpA-like peptidoglycan-associated protein
MKVSTRSVALAFGAGFVALACRAHVETRAAAEQDAGGMVYPSGEIAWGLAGSDAGPPEPEPPPVVDSDGDGIPDAKDACPSEPEDKDGFEDQDGCPDPDNDHDRIPDVKDRCPNEPETYNGVEDDDGCPDARAAQRGAAPQSQIKEGPIAFDDNSAVIRPSTAAILDSIAVFVRDRPYFSHRIMLKGHAATHERHPRALADARGAAVRRYLVKHGVPSRAILLASHAYNPVYPYLGDEPDGASDGRRVELEFWGAR